MDITYYKKYEPLFGSWKIVREIGEGSFGKVFEIEREDFGYTYKAAMKAITIPQSRSEIENVMDDGMDQDSVTSYFRGFVEELVEEFRLMSKLKGESNIVSYEDHQVIAHEDGIGWDVLIRMELLTPLTKYIKEHGSDESGVIRLGIDICKALELCRRHSIVHRDIKPENIFVSENGKFKLGDFGIAKTVEKTTGGLSKKGTYTYMAPEVYKGEPYGASVDIYSLGLVLYRLCNNNRTPFLPEYPERITFRDRESAIVKRITGEPLPVPANADEYLGKIILKACAYKLEDRYSSPREMREDLEAIASGAIPAHVAISVHDDVTVKEPVGSEDPTVPESVERKEPENSDADDFDRTTSMFVMGVNGSKSNNAAKAEPPTNPPEPKKSPIKPPEPKKPPVKKPKKQPKEKAEKLPKEKNKKKILIIAAALLLVVVAAIGIMADRSQTDIVAVSAGGDHSVGLRSDGTVVATGANGTGQCNVSGWTDIVSVSAGSGHTVGLRSNGTVVANGGNEYGQCNVSKWAQIVAVSAGSGHTVGLRSDGKVFATGLNDLGQCDVSGWTDIIAVSAGGSHTVGLRSDGTVVATGANGAGQCDVSGWTDIIAVSAGGFHTVGLRSNGTVVATGANGAGQCNVSKWAQIVAVSAGSGNTVGLRTNGTVVAIGANGACQCNVSDWTDIVAVSAGGDHIVGLRSDGTVAAKGWNEYGQCDISGWTGIAAIINLRRLF